MRRTHPALMAVAAGALTGFVFGAAGFAFEPALFAWRPAPWGKISFRLLGQVGTWGLLGATAGFLDLAGRVVDRKWPSRRDR